MVSVIDFLTELGNSIVDLGGIFANDIAFGDPLAFLSFLMGTLFILFSVGVMGYLALGAFGRELGIVTPTPRRNPSETRPRH